MSREAMAKQREIEMDGVRIKIKAHEKLRTAYTFPKLCFHVVLLVVDVGQRINIKAANKQHTKRPT